MFPPKDFMSRNFIACVQYKGFMSKNIGGIIHFIGNLHLCSGLKLFYRPYLKTSAPLVLYLHSQTGQRKCVIWYHFNMATFVLIVVNLGQGGKEEQKWGPEERIMGNQWSWFYWTKLFNIDSERVQGLTFSYAMGPKRTNCQWLVKLLLIEERWSLQFVSEWDYGPKHEKGRQNRIVSAWFRNVIGCRCFTLTCMTHDRCIIKASAVWESYFIISHYHKSN